MEHRVTYKVYYEDTDCIGIVYHANYLKYMERGRTEYIAHHGRDIQEWNQLGFYFVVYSMTIKFRKAATLGDILDVISTFTLTSQFRGLFRQRIEREGVLIVEAEVELVCLDANQSLQPMPDLLT